jgi:hypothetical protein
MYPEELEKLVEFALVDGNVSNSERQILIKKAISLGIDKAEFEMVLDAKIFKLNQSKSQQTSEDTSSTKCENCQSPLDSFTTTCSYCGYDIIQKKSTHSIQRLFELLNEAENQRRPDSDNPFSAIGKFYADAFSQFSGPSKVDRKKMEIIASFPIPTTKTDILEFLALSLPKARSVGNFFTRNTPENKAHNQFVQVWKNKCEQIVLKAKFAMKDDPETLKEILKYAAELEIS